MMANFRGVSNQSHPFAIARLLAKITGTRLAYGPICELKCIKAAQSGGFFTTAKQLSALAGQQRRALTARAAWQVIQLLRRRETVEFGFLADDHWLVLRLTRAADCRFLARSIIARRATATTAARPWPAT